MEDQMRKSRTKAIVTLAIVLVALITTACNPNDVRDVANAWLDGGMPASEALAKLSALAAEAEGATVNPVPGVAVTYQPFTPDWSGLSTTCPPVEEVLAAHGITLDMLEGNQVVPHPAVSWDPCLVVVELKEEFRGTEISLHNGYQYTPALADGRVEIFWGGDPNLPTVGLLYGTSFRWGPTYSLNKATWWLNPADPRELACREHRFGRHRRNPDSGLADVPYYNRVGPYWTGVGNLDTQGWVPPALDATVARNYLDACAMFGGRAVESEWKYGEPESGGYLNWHWEYTGKVDGSATYCDVGSECWQTVYPPSGPGYVEIWLDVGARGPDGTNVATAGPYKFYASDLDILLDGNHNADEFSVHLDPNR